MKCTGMALKVDPRSRECEEKKLQLFTSNSQNHHRVHILSHPCMQIVDYFNNNPPSLPQDQNSVRSNSQIQTGQTATQTTICAVVCSALHIARLLYACRCHCVCHSVSAPSVYFLTFLAPVLFTYLHARCMRPIRFPSIAQRTGPQ